jgi:hypothetical protein
LLDFRAHQGRTFWCPSRPSVSRPGIIFPYSVSRKHIVHIALTWQCAALLARCGSHQAAKCMLRGLATWPSMTNSTRIPDDVRTADAVLGHGRGFPDSEQPAGHTTNGSPPTRPRTNQPAISPRSAVKSVGILSDRAETVHDKGAMHAESDCRRFARASRATGLARAIRKARARSFHLLRLYWPRTVIKAPSQHSEAYSQSNHLQFPSLSYSVPCFGNSGVTIPLWANRSYAL